MTTGKLYQSSDNEFITEVNYKFQDESDTGWWGELTLTDYKRIKDNDIYIIELDDMRRWQMPPEKAGEPGGERHPTPLRVPVYRPQRF